MIKGVKKTFVGPRIRWRVETFVRKGAGVYLSEERERAV